MSASFSNDKMPKSAEWTASIHPPAQKAPSPDDDSDTKSHHPRPGSRAFRNPWPSYLAPFGHHSKMRTQLRITFGQFPFGDGRESTLKVQKPQFLPTRDTPELRATWLGHACYLIEFTSGIRVLFDPVFDERCSPLSFAGPKRFTKTPCQIEDIPIVDAVIISHNHYDHLSYPTIMRLVKKHPKVHFFVPLKNTQWLLNSGIPAASVTELDWWEQAELTLTPNEDVITLNSKRLSPSPESVHATADESPRITANGSTANTPESTVNAPESTVTANKPNDESAKTPGQISLHESTPQSSGATLQDSSSETSCMKATISSLPSQHRSNRGGNDFDHALWSSWAISSGGQQIYFAGDTGYRQIPNVLHETDSDDHTAYDESQIPHCPAFAQIGALRGPFDLGLLPIGAYMPRTMHSGVHSDPYDSVEIFRDTRCKRALAMHWGTWSLTSEPVMEPPQLLRKALRRRNLPETGVFDVIDIGESRPFGLASVDRT